MASIFPAVAPDGSWTLPGFPRGGPAFPPWRFAEDPPAQASDIADARCQDFGDGIVWLGPVEAHHVTHIPTVIPNAGIPFTSINVSTLMLDGIVGQQSLIDLMRDFYTARGEEVLGVCVWEHRQPRTGPDLLGYEIEVFTKGQAQPFQPQLVLPPDVQPAIVITTLGLALILFAGMIVLDAFTGGQLGILDAFGQAWETITDSVEGVIIAPFKGVATVVVVGVAAFVGGAILLSRTGVEPEIATAALAGGGAAATEIARTPAAIASAAAGAASGGRRPAGRGRSRS
jgi:hypothetical protein